MDLYIKCLYFGKRILDCKARHLLHIEELCICHSQEILYEFKYLYYIEMGYFYIFLSRHFKIVFFRRKLSKYCFFQVQCIWNINVMWHLYLKYRYKNTLALSRLFSATNYDEKANHLMLGISSRHTVTDLLTSSIGTDAWWDLIWPNT